jgi:hypothetical protein
MFKFLSLAALLLCTTNINAKDKYKFGAFLTPKTIKFIYSDLNSVVKDIETDKIQDLVSQKTKIIQFEDIEEQIELSSLEKILGSEIKKIDFLRNEIKLKKILLVNIKEKLNNIDRLKKHYTLDEINNIKSDIYFYEREIYRYNIDFVFFNNKFMKIKKRVDKVKQRIEDRKIFLENVFIDEIFVKEGQSVFKYDKLIKFYSIKDMSIRIKLTEEEYKDILNYYLDVVVYHNTVELPVKKIKINIEEKSKDKYIIINLEEVSKYFLKDKLDVYITKTKKFNSDSIFN